jgi:N-acetylglucosamine kinase-like BadF-type ATPase
MLNQAEYTIVGIDGGGTHTRGVLYRNNQIVAKAQAGTSRIGSVGFGESCERTLNVIQDLCNQTEIETSEIDALVVGLAGVWLEDEKKRAVSLLRTLSKSQNMVLNDVVVISDAEIALEGALEEDNGIIIIVGTGSIGIARNGSEKLLRCGGWGIELDDEGSGAWIGREGLTAVVRDLDGRGKNTALTKLIAGLSPIIDLENPRTIVKAFAERSFEYYMISPLVMKCAVDGDDVCLDIIERSAEHLTELPITLAKKFNEKKVKVTLLGGIIDNDTLLAQKLIKKLKTIKSLEVIQPKGNALNGAITIGKRMIANSEEL